MTLGETSAVLAPYEYICVQNAHKIIFNAWKTFVVKAFRRMNGDSIL
jgi:hypothetical protein